MRRKLIAFSGYAAAGLDIAFLCYAVYGAIAYMAFHTQGIQFIMSAAAVLGMTAYLCLSSVKPERKEILWCAFWASLLIYWTVIVAGNTLLNELSFLYGEDMIEPRPFYTLRTWRKMGLYIPFFSHLLVMFPYGFCIPFALRRGAKIGTKFRLLLGLCLLLALVWTMVLGKALSIDNILLWLLGGVLGYLMQSLFSACMKNRRKNNEEQIF